MNGQMLVKWLSEQFWDVVHVFMSSFSETADADSHCESITRSVCMCAVNENRTVCVIH